MQGEDPRKMLYLKSKPIKFGIRYYYLIFAGDGDVEIFMFYVVLRDMNEDEKSIKLLAHLDGRAFEFSFQRSTTDGKLTEEAA